MRHEATKNVLAFDPTIGERHPNIPWRNVRDIGNLLRHEYENVDAEVVWETVTSGKLRALVTSRNSNSRNSMAEISNSPASIREKFQQLIVDDLLGPAAGPEETLPTQPVPRDRYLVGLLAPKASYVSETATEIPLLADVALDMRSRRRETFRRRRHHRDRQGPE